MGRPLSYSRPRRDLSDTYIAWAAGLFEGEGCISLDGNNYPKLILAMTDGDVVERFAAVMGDGNIRVTIPKDPKHKPQYRWTKGGKIFVLGVYELFGPYLGTRRAEKFREVLLASGALTSDDETI